VTVHGSEDEWAELGDRFVDGHYGSLRGRVRTYVIHAHLRDHLAPTPMRIVDVGGGAGNQSIPLALEGYDVTIVDPSRSMLDRARARADAAEVTARVRLVEAAGEDTPAVLDGERLGGVLCHGVLMYVDDPGPLVDALCAVAGPGGIVSIVAKNVAAMR
jgi:S-adenosylmethionine-dependent methyltransferase